MSLDYLVLFLMSGICSNTEYSVHFLALLLLKRKNLYIIFIYLYTIYLIYIFICIFYIFILVYILIYKFSM